MPPLHPSREFDLRMGDGERRPYEIPGKDADPRKNGAMLKTRIML